MRRILIRHYRPLPAGDGPSWLTVIGHARDSLWSVDLFRCESILLRSFWVMVVMDVFSRRISALALPRLISTARSSVGCSIARSPGRPHRNIFPQINDPLFRFHRWLANLRILEIDEIKAIPCTPRSHAFVERLIGTLRREHLDRTLFWNRSDLERKLDDYKTYYNQYRCHTGLAGATPAQRSGAPPHPIAKVESYSWQRHCHGLFETPIAA